VNDLLAQEQRINEPWIAYFLSKEIPPHFGLFSGNSMPVRNLDYFAFSSDKTIPITANRGVSGIEGNIACAAGYAEGLEKPVVLLIGDISFLHDLNSLYYLKKMKQPLIIVLINNNGGDIFTLLPVSNVPEVFEEYFTVPHGLNFEAGAKQFGVAYSRCESKKDFEALFLKAVQDPVSQIIEVMTGPNNNKEFQHKINEVLSRLKAGL
jgi:2-succinyl-5-enolpyruvyl-6-hydroxy-3-cyclohexene-1-carboxylate synthase